MIRKKTVDTFGQLKLSFAGDIRDMNISPMSDLLHKGEEVGIFIHIA